MIFFILLIGFFFTIHVLGDSSLWEVIGQPRNKILFWGCALLILLFLTMASTPGIFVDRPAGVYNGNAKAEILLKNWNQEKTLVSVVGFISMILMILLSPFWHRKKAGEIKEDYLFFALTGFITGVAILLSFYPEFFIGQRPRSSDVSQEVIDIWLSRRNILSKAYLIPIFLFIGTKIFTKRKVFNIFGLNL